MDWGELFERAGDRQADVADIRSALADRRDGDRTSADEDDESHEEATGYAAADEHEPSPARIVADADVLAADLLVAGDGRDALDHVRAHSWVTLVASEVLLADAEAVVATLTDADLAADWRATVADRVELVGHPPEDHPALATALRGGAMHVLSYDEGLQSPAAGAAIRAHVETSIKEPAAFVQLFDPERLYPEVADGDYPGPDRDPRA